MNLTRIYAGDDGESHFEDINLAVDTSQRRVTSRPIAATKATFGFSEALPAQDWHHAPRRQLVAILSGALEIEVGDGTTRQLVSGDAFIADDLSGRGHQTRDIAGPVRLLYVHLPDNFDPTSLRS